MSATKIAPGTTGREPDRQSGVGRLSTSTVSTTAGASAAAVDPDQMLDRLEHLRAILPVFAQELATSRRHAAQLRRENRRLLEEVHRLQRKHERGAAR